MWDEKTLRDFFDQVNRRDLERLGGMLAENAEFHFPKTQPLLGRRRILGFFSILFRQFPELNFTVLRTISQDNAAAVHWTNRGVSRKGDRYENEGVTLLESVDGKIVLMSDFFKDTGKF